MSEQTTDVVEVEPTEEDVIEEQGRALEPLTSRQPSTATRDEWSADELIAQVEKIGDVMKRAMTEGVHYGKIPGVQKPTLLKPGAERLNVVFRLAPSYPEDRLKVETFEDGHRDVICTCVLTHIPTGLIFGEGLGSCSTREVKYAYRQGQRICPNCGEAEVRKSKQNKDEYYCWNNPGKGHNGCGTTWSKGTPEYEAFETTDTSRIDNPELPDQWNTILKMAAKRALIAATLNATGASDVFTQDGEEQVREPVERRVEGPPPPPLPESWGELIGRLDRVVTGQENPETPAAIEWLREATEAHFGKTRADLDESQQTELRIYAASTLMALEEVHGGKFPPPSRDEIAKVFAAKFGGVALIGPPWRTGPTEELPTYADWLAEQDKADAEADAIEFPDPTKKP